MSLSREAIAVRCINHRDGQLVGDNGQTVFGLRLIEPDITGTTIDVYRTSGDFRALRLFSRNPSEPGQLYLPPNRAVVAAVYPYAHVSRTDEFIKMMVGQEDFFSVASQPNTQGQRVTLYLAVSWSSYILDWWAKNRPQSELQPQGAIKTAL